MTSATELTLDKKLAFWKTAFLHLGKNSQSAQEDIAALIDAIDAGMLGPDVVQSCGAQLLTMALARWPKQDTVYGESNAYVNLHEYSPGQVWTDKGVYFPQERIVASLLAAGADPWSEALAEREAGLFPTEHTVRYPALFVFQHSDPPRSAFAAFLNHPNCPDPQTLALHRNAKGESFLDMAVRSDIGCLRLLLDKGVDPNAPGKSGLPPLFHASSSDCVKALVDAGAKTDVVNQSGDSLAMHWAIHSPYTASSMSSVLPKSSSQANTISLNALINTLLKSNKQHVSSVLSQEKDIPNREWVISGQSLNLMDIAVSVAAFMPPHAVFALLGDLSLKKYAWKERDRDTLSVLMDYVWDNKGRPSEEVEKFKKSTRFKSETLDPLRLTQVLDRMLAVRKAAFGSHVHKDLEESTVSRIHYGWMAAMEKIAAQGPEWDDALLASFSCTQRTMEEAKRVAPFFSDTTFTLMMNYAKRKELPQDLWQFWTGMGIMHGSIREDSAWDFWTSTLENKDPSWVNDPLIQRSLAVRATPDPRMMSIVENLQLNQHTPTPELPNRPSRRI